MQKEIAAGLRAVESDHRLLLDIFHDIEAISLPCMSKNACVLADCADQSHCSHMARELLHRVHFATIGHFGREERLMRDHDAPAEQFQAHAAGHAEIKDAIQQSIAAFAADKDAVAVFDRLTTISRMYRQHHHSLDAACRLQLMSGKNRPRSATMQYRAVDGAAHHLPDLPLTGNAVIDHKHTILQNILRQAKSLCCRHSPHCQHCSPDRQQDCTVHAVDIVTDALKTMIEHFRHEETLMRQYATPKATEEHQQAHADISQRMNQLIGDYADNNTAMFLHRLTETLHAWLRHHVAEHDLPLISQAGNANERF